MAGKRDSSYFSIGAIMRKFIALLLLLTSVAYGVVKFQTGPLILGTKQNSGTELLQLNSTTQGFLPPRMTAAEATTYSLLPPSAGALIYNTTDGELQIWNGASFVSAGGGGISAWITGFDYNAGNVVHESNKIYLALTTHTSGVFATDLGNNEWVELSAIDFTNNPITGVLPIANGGTNSSTALVDDRVMISSSGAIVHSPTIDTTELGYLDGVTSLIQTQLDAKLDDFVSTTDNAIVRTDTNGEAVQGSGVVIDDLDNMSGLNQLDVDQLRLDGNTISSTNAAGDIILDPDTTGNVQLPDLTPSTPLKLDASSNIIAGDIDLTTDVTGVLPVANGGTNVNSLAATQILFGGAGGTAIAQDSELQWNNTNKRLQVGAGLSNRTLNVNGTSLFSGVMDLTDDLQLFTAGKRIYTNAIDAIGTDIASRPYSPMTLTERGNLTLGTPDEGRGIWNETDNLLQIWDGTAWQDVGANPFNQTLNTTDNVTFNTVTATTSLTTDLINIGVDAIIDNPFGRLELQTTDQAADSENTTLTTGDSSGGATGQLNLRTGNASTTSGDILLLPGTGATRGDIRFQDGSEGTIGHVWTSTGILGEGEWQAAAASSGISQWVTANSYSLNDIVWYDGLIYQAQSAHTSGTFATDLASGYWLEMTNTIPLMGKGSILTSNGTDNGEFTACPDGEVLIADSSQTSGFICKPHATEAVTNWTDAGAITISATTTAPTKGASIDIDKMFYRRVGDSMELRYQYEQNTGGTAGSGTYLIDIPSGFTIDTAKFSTTATSAETRMVGYGHVTTGSDGRDAHFYMWDSNTLAMEYAIGANASITATSHPMSNATFRFSGIVTIPIVGWSSNNSVTAFDCDGLECENSFSARIDSGGNVVSENVNWISGSTCPINTTWRRCTLNTDLGLNSPLSCTVNREGANTTGVSTMESEIGGTTTTYIEYGITESGVGNNAFAATIHCERQGSDYNQYNHRFAKVDANGSHEVHGAGNGGTSLTANVTNIDFTEVTDAEGIWNGTQFTAPEAGYYSVEGMVYFNGASSAGIQSYVDGVANLYMGLPYGTPTARGISGTIYLTAGQVLSLRSDTTGTLSNNTSLHHITIRKTRGNENAFITGNISESTFTETVKTEGATNPVFYSAYVAAAGTVSNEYSAWINGNAAVTDTSLFTLTLETGIFGSNPNCTVTTVDGGTNSITHSKIASSSTTSIAVRTGYSQTTTNFTKLAYPFFIQCHGVK